MKTQIFLAIFSTLIIFSSCSKKQPTPLKLMTWNIWHGGLHGEKSNDFLKDSANTVNTLKIIEQANPDILFMQETYCCGMEVAKEAGYKYSYRGSSNLSIHSKYPIIDTIKIYKPFNSNAVIINVEGDKILCVNIWLHYLPDVFIDMKKYSPDSLIAGEGTTRLKEIKAILKCVDSLEKSLNIPVFMAGDFNSGSHLDWIEKTKEFHFNKIVEWPVSKLMMEKGYIDSFRETNSDIVNSLDGTWGFLSEDIISDRIDFIYYKGDNIETKYSEIVQDDPVGGFFNSDHRAILSTFEISNY